MLCQRQYVLWKWIILVPFAQILFEGWASGVEAFGFVRPGDLFREAGNLRRRWKSTSGAERRCMRGWVVLGRLLQQNSGRWSSYQRPGLRSQAWGAATISSSVPSLSRFIQVQFLSHGGWWDSVDGLVLILVLVRSWVTGTGGGGDVFFASCRLNLPDVSLMPFVSAIYLPQHWMEQ